jgi:hypothetical protein
VSNDDDHNEKSDAYLDAVWSGRHDLFNAARRDLFKGRVVAVAAVVDARGVPLIEEDAVLAVGE